MTNLKASTKYDFVSRSIGSVPTHAFDWDLEVYFDSRIYPGQYATKYDCLSRILFDVAISASEELGHHIAQCGAGGDHRARLVAISVEEVSSLPDEVRLQRDMMYGGSWRSGPQLRPLRTFRAVVTISQTHSNSHLSSLLEEDFQSAVAADLSINLIKSANMLAPFCLVCSSSRSKHGALVNYGDELPKRISEPDAFGFHESGLHASFGETSLEDPFKKANKNTGFFLHLRAQFALHSLSRLTGGVEASEVFLETLISFGYQLALVKRGKSSVPFRACLRERCVGSVYVDPLVRILKGQGEAGSPPQANVSIYLPLDRSQSLNQAQRNKLRFFVDKDIRHTFGLTPDESKSPCPHMQALLNNLFVDQLKWWEV
jgi:hypothetical protein